VLSVSLTTIRSGSRPARLQPPSRIRTMRPPPMNPSDFPVMTSAFPFSCWSRVYDAWANRCRCLSVQKPFRSASGRPEVGPRSTPKRLGRRFRAVPAADDAVSSTRDSLLHHDPVDVPSVQPVSGVPGFGRRSAGWGWGALPAGLRRRGLCAARHIFSQHVPRSVLPNCRSIAVVACQLLGGIW
jgi:hypothetical protein